MSSFDEGNESLSDLPNILSEAIKEKQLNNGFGVNRMMSPKKMKRSISETAQNKNCDKTNEMPDTLNMRLNAAGRGLPNEIDCKCEAVSKDSSSIQYECKYQLSNISPEKGDRENTCQLLTESDRLDVNSQHGLDTAADECAQGKKRMTIENLPAARIHGKFSLNLPYVYFYLFIIISHIFTCISFLE